MVAGFDLFMHNPWWRKLYEEAPSDELREHLRRSFEYSFAMICVEEDAAERTEDESPVYLSKGDYLYLYDHAEGGCYRAFLRNQIERFDKEEKGGK